MGRRLKCALCNKMRPSNRRMNKGNCITFTLNEERDAERLKGLGVCDDVISNFFKSHRGDENRLKACNICNLTLGSGDPIKARKQFNQVWFIDGSVASNETPSRAVDSHYCCSWMKRDSDQNHIATLSSLFKDKDQFESFCSNVVEGRFESLEKVLWLGSRRPFRDDGSGR